QKEITIEAEMPDLYIVKDGLAQNELILFEGLRKVRDKQKISYVYMNVGRVIGNLKVDAE
ncbi:MAG: efflux RND transporter periplasmic adaptor subunit, partial [Cytophagaceae bacterium]|nr:efflux RND transporter periplasmic adaptor subunit [Cytophagaceae bacterium]